RYDEMGVAWEALLASPSLSRQRHLTTLPSVRFRGVGRPVVRAARRGVSEAKAIPGAKFDLVRDRRREPPREPIDQPGEERPAQPDGGRAGGHPCLLCRSLDRPLDVTDLVDEAELDRLLGEPDLAGRDLDRPRARHAAAFGHPVDERLVEAVDQGLLLRALLLRVLAPG